MPMHPDVTIDTEVNRHFRLQVGTSKKREGLFVLKPVGSLNAMTSRSLEKTVERISGARPIVVMFDLRRVDFINSKGLRVILKVCRSINAQGGRVVLMNFQPHIKEVFEIINALPEQRIFSNWHAFTNYLGAVQNRYVDAGCLKQSEIGTDNSIICAEINTNQRNEMHPL